MLSAYRGGSESLYIPLASGHGGQQDFEPKLPEGK